MSQKKVDLYKQEKAGRKAAAKRKKLFHALYALIAVLVVIGVGLLIYKATRPVYNVNVEDSKFDDVALASVLGYDGVNISDYVDSVNEISDEDDESSEVIDVSDDSEE